MMKVRVLFVVICLLFLYHGAQAEKLDNQEKVQKADAPEVALDAEQVDANHFLLPDGVNSYSSLDANNPAHKLNIPPDDIATEIEPIQEPLFLEVMGDEHIYKCNPPLPIGERVEPEELFDDNGEPIDLYKFEGIKDYGFMLRYYEPEKNIKLDILEKDSSSK